MDRDRLRVALLVYRGNPHSGGQGVYTRYLSRELVGLGHSVTVFSGQPWPVLDPGVELVRVPHALAIKINLPRPIIAGSPGDHDVYGAQQHVPLLDIEL